MLCLPGPGEGKRRKVLKTTYNEKGEEVTEVIWEIDPAGVSQEQPEAQGGVKENQGEPVLGCPPPMLSYWELFCSTPRSCVSGRLSFCPESWAGMVGFCIFPCLKCV